MIVNVAMLGARGQIARSISPHLPAHWRVTLFSRSSDDGALPYEALPDHQFDLIINAAGPGDPAIHRAGGLDTFRIIEYFDNLSLDYVRRNPGCAYIFMSTGAVYGNGYECPGDEDSILRLPVNGLGQAHNYLLAKLVAEAKHRAVPDHRIADLRVFGYVSAAMNLESGFFLAEAARCLKEGRPFVTNAADFHRDIVSPEDLARLITILAGAGVPNGAYDACSAAPTTKFAILDLLEHRFGLKVEVEPSGERNRLPVMDRLSNLQGAIRLGYRAEFTSIESVEQAFDRILRLA